MPFFNQHRVLYPWPSLLRRTGFRYRYKPREMFWFRQLNQVGFKRGMKILDVGCGRGEFLDRLISQYGVKGWGVDLSDRSIEEAKKKTIHQACFQVSDVTNLPFNDGEFNAVVCFDVLEHVADQQKAVLEMVRVTKPKGKVIVYTISARQKWTPNWWLEKIGLDMYSPFDHRKERLIEPGWLKKEFKRAGLRRTKIGFCNSFWTLWVDEVIMVGVAVWGRIGGWRNESTGRLVLAFLTIINRLFEPVLRLAEWPWRVVGLSNGFLIIGTKR